LKERLSELEDEYKRLKSAEADWTAHKLQSPLRTQLRGDQVLLVARLRGDVDRAWQRHR
jgi:hypothetical protein